MNITKCKECGCTKMAEDRVADLERQLEEAHRIMRDEPDAAVFEAKALQAQLRESEVAREGMHRAAQDSLAEAVAMMLVFKKQNVPWDWQSTERNLERVAAALSSPSGLRDALVAVHEALEELLPYVEAHYEIHQVDAARAALKLLEPYIGGRA